MVADLLPDLPVSLGVVAAGGLYVHADRAVAAVRSPWRRRAFLAGLAVIAVALLGPIDARADSSLTDHMVQHLLLTMVAAPLLVLGAPITLALQRLDGQARRPVIRALHGFPLRSLSNPLIAWSAFIGVMWVTHETGLYEAALRSQWVHAAEHLVFLVSAILFWMPVFGVEPTTSRLSHPARILYLFLAMPAMTFLGLAISSADGVLYPAYAAAEGTARALADQRMAGALMWNVGLVLLLPAMALVLFDWMRSDERAARRIDERLLHLRGSS